ncbi:unnamed protein product [marine sediment metagenome]|uniref:Uncharacterized protein n=1 Tax=marine sediment metagenome TaxID=412755 RepID=X0VR41_9ZZZZ
MEKWTPPCMDEKKITSYPKCKMKAKNGNDGTCSIFVALGCHGFYPSSEDAKSNKHIEPTQ